RTRDLEHRTVRLRATREMVTLDDTGEAATLADPDDVDEPFALKRIHQYAISNLHRAVCLGLLFGFDWHLAHELHRRQIVLGKVSAHRLCDSRFLSQLNA